MLAHRTLAGFDCGQSKVDGMLIQQLAACDFVEAAANVVLIGSRGTGKTRLATALGAKVITQLGKVTDMQTPTEDKQEPF